MFDLGWSELLVIGIVALIVVGPKDLPVMFRKLGEFTGKARRMAREFSSAMNEAGRESGMSDVTKDLRNIANPKQFGMDAIKDAAREATAWEPDPDAPPPPKTGDAERAAKSATSVKPDPGAPVPPEAPAPAAEPGPPAEPTPAPAAAEKP